MFRHRAAKYKFKIFLISSWFWFTPCRFYDGVFYFNKAGKSSKFAGRRQRLLVPVTFDSLIVTLC